MQFKNPEVFCFLFLLLIPVIVHLFQLQKFKKIAFTNVEFLKKISLDSRKSSRLKKYLILASRILGLLSLLFVFSQPYFSNKESSKITHHTIYLDNSLSMNSNGKKGDLLKNTAQEIINNIYKNDRFSLLTNDNFYKNISSEELKNELKNIKYSQNTLNFEEIILRLSRKNKTSINTLNKNIFISDFQNINKIKFTNVNIDFELFQALPEVKNNVSIDSVYINNSTIDALELIAVIKNQGATKNEIPIALYNNTTLINKHSFSIQENEIKNISFSLPKETTFNGKIQITLNDTFSFDNTFLFSTNPTKKINILSIGKKEKKLSKLYPNNEFNFTNSSLQETNYNTLKNQHFIILNQLENIPITLINSLKDYLNEDGHLLIIPDEEININSYNSFLSNTTNGKIISRRIDTLQIRQINYNHPLFNNVFTKKVTNFQSPYSTINYSNNITGSSIIGLENNDSFLKKVDTQIGHLYFFNSPLDITMSNFYNSPLIVPTLYNMGSQSLRFPAIYYTLAKENVIEINHKTNSDEVIQIEKESFSFIPLQQKRQNKISITTNENPLERGFYHLTYKDQTIQTIAFNHQNTESSLNYLNIKDLQSNNLRTHDSIEELFSEINQENEVVWIWKLFLALTIVSLLFEILILKFFKT